MKSSVYLLTAALAAATNCANASAVFFFNDIVADRSDFQLSAGVPVVLESFEDSFAPGTLQTFPVADGTTVTVTTSDELSYWTDLPGRLISDGTASLAVPEGTTTFVQFTFSRPIKAFGIDVLDLNFTDISYEDDLGNTLSNLLLGDNCGPAGGGSCVNLQFFGVTNVNAFTEILLTFSTPVDTGTVTFDRLEFAPVPVPAALTLFATALAGLGFVKKVKLRQDLARV